jgi:hypothetical protein
MGQCLNRKKKGDDDYDYDDGPVYVSTTKMEWNEKDNHDLNNFLFAADSEEDSGVFLALLTPTYVPKKQTVEVAPIVTNANDDESV